MLFLSIVHLSLILFMALTKRLGDFQPFGRTTLRADGRQGGLECGFLTYGMANDVETYQVSSVEFSGRSDHLAEPLVQLVGGTVEVLNSASPLESDADLIQPKPEVTASPKPAAVEPTPEVAN